MILDAGEPFRSSIQVRYAETDAMRFVYYANHLVYFEVARTEALAEMGLPYPRLESEGWAIPVLQAHCDYLSPARYGDTLEIRSSCRLVDGLRLRFAYEVRRVGDACDLVSSGHTVHVCMGLDGRPRRPHPGLVESIARRFPAIAGSSSGG